MEKGDGCTTPGMYLMKLNCSNMFKMASFMLCIFFHNKIKERRTLRCQEVEMLCSSHWVCRGQSLAWSSGNLVPRGHVLSHEPAGLTQLPQICHQCQLWDGPRDSHTRHRWPTTIHTGTPAQPRLELEKDACKYTLGSCPWLSPSFPPPSLPELVLLQLIA